MGVGETPSEDRRPPSRRIADELRARIVGGELQAGTRLPSERQLAQTYSTARNTAREAVSILAVEGLVDVQHGRGAFVRLRPPLLRLGATRYSKTLRTETGLSPYRAEVVRQGRTPDVEFRSVRRDAPPPEVAERLDVPVTSKSVIRRENRYLADGEPVQVAVTFIPWAIAEGTVLSRKVDTGPGGIYARLEELGHPVIRIREEVTARMPTPEEVRDLAIPAGVPVIELLHTSIDAAGTPFEVTRFVMRADLGGLDYSMPVEE